MHYLTVILDHTLIIASMPFFIKRSYETNGFMLESPEHVFALSRMLLFGFTEATGSVCERCDTFGDLLLETRLQTEPDMTHSQMLGKFEYTRGPIFKVVLEC